MVKLTLFCDSCGTEMKVDKEEYEEHIRIHHPKKINVKEMFLKAVIRRELDGS